MVDVLTYNKMHLTNYPMFAEDNGDFTRYDKWPFSMRRDSKMSDEMYMLLPAVTNGFDLEKKRWGEFGFILKQHRYCPSFADNSSHPQCGKLSACEVEQKGL